MKANATQIRLSGAVVSPVLACRTLLALLITGRMANWDYGTIGEWCDPWIGSCFSWIEEITSR